MYTLTIVVEFCREHEVFHNICNLCVLVLCFRCVCALDKATCIFECCRSQVVCHLLLHLKCVLVFAESLQDLMGSSDRHESEYSLPTCLSLSHTQTKLYLDTHIQETYQHKESVQVVSLSLSVYVCLSVRARMLFVLLHCVCVLSG